MVHTGSSESAAGSLGAVSFRSIPAAHTAECAPVCIADCACCTFMAAMRSRRLRGGHWCTFQCRVHACRGVAAADQLCEVLQTMEQTSKCFVDRFQVLGQEMHLAGNCGVVQVATLRYNSAV